MHAKYNEFHSVSYDSIRPIRDMKNSYLALFETSETLVGVIFSFLGPEIL